MLVSVWYGFIPKDQYQDWKSLQCKCLHRTCVLFAEGQKHTHRVVGLIDAEQEDELREEERRYQVPVDGVEVGAEPAQEAQQDEGEEEEQQGDRDRGVGDDLQGEDITVLCRAVPRKSDVSNEVKAENSKLGWM